MIRVTFLLLGSYQVSWTQMRYVTFPLCYSAHRIANYRIANKKFQSCTRVGRKQIWVPEEESNLIISDSVLRCSTTKQQRLNREPGHDKVYMWHSSCILPGSGMSKASCEFYVRVRQEWLILSSVTGLEINARKLANCEWFWLPASEKNIH